MSAVLVLLILVPLLSAIAVAALGAQRGPIIRLASLGSTLLSLALATVVCLHFANTRYEKSVTVSKFFEDPQNIYTTNISILPMEPGSDGGAIRFEIGLDGLSVWLILLTALLMVCAVLSSWTAVTERLNEYFAWMLVLQMAMTGVFLSIDIVLFYVFFELTLIPLFFLIGIWGGPQRQYAARKFFVFTLSGSLITLLGVIGIILAASRDPESGGVTLSIPTLITQVHEHEKRLLDRVNQSQADLGRATADTSASAQRKLDDAQKDYDGWLRLQTWLFAAMMVGFMVKVPLFPVHTWLPLAHTEAPTAGSVLLAGVLLKLGTYGFLRLLLPLMPHAAVTFGAPVITWLAAIGVIYGAFCALMQDDIKKMIAYSSVSHLGLCMIGLFALNEVGMMGSLLQMINHGLSTGALFLIVGMLYERYHTRKIDDYSGMAAKLKLLAVAFVFMTMSSIGLPGLNGFVGEVTAMMGMFATKVPSINGVLMAALAATGVILGAWYMLTLTMRVFFGPLKEPEHHGHAIHDLNVREVVTLLPIAVACLVIGLYSPSVTRVAEPEIKYVADLQRKAIERTQ